MVRTTTTSRRSPEREVYVPSKPVILCVDDEPAGLIARRLVLSTAGYAVLTAASGAIALRLLTCNQVDLVVTDHLLPDLSGVDLISSMKQLKPDVPIILLTGLVDPPPGFEKADMLLTKGITPPEFLAEIERLLSQRWPNGTASV